MAIGQCFRCGGQKPVKLFTGKFYQKEHAIGLNTFLCSFCERKVKSLQRRGFSSVGNRVPKSKYGPNKKFNNAVEEAVYNAAWAAIEAGL